MKSNKSIIAWTSQLAYAIGLLTTDGNLSSDGRHIDFTSKDKDQVENFVRCLGLKNKISQKYSGAGNMSWRVQFGNVEFYRFLNDIGLMQKKSKTIKRIIIPDDFFLDFLRGHLDGDGSFHSYWDKRWRSSFMFYTIFASASGAHIRWLRSRIHELFDIQGHVTKTKTNSFYQLKYAKAESLKLLPKLYYDTDVVCLSRKRRKIEKALLIMSKHL